MFVFFFLGEFLETVLAVKLYGRQICIDGNVSESRLILADIEPLLQLVHQPSSNALPAIVHGNGKAPDLDAGITAELLADGELRPNLLPSAASNLAATDSVVQQTEISGNTSFVFKNERIGNAKILRVLGIVEQEPVEASSPQSKAASG